MIHSSEGRADLVCDSAGCAAVFHGFNQPRDEVLLTTGSRVRAHAKGFGWRSFHKGGCWQDACPDCVKHWVAQGAPKAANPNDDQGELL